MDIGFRPPVKKSELPYAGKRISVRLDWVDCGTENLILREVVLHPGAVVILPISEDGMIFLVRQFRHPLDAVTYELPAGTKEKYEDSLETAKRELAEEAKLKAQSWENIGILHPLPGLSNEKQDLYVAKNLSATFAETDPGEFVEVQSFSYAEIKKMISNNAITDAKTISTIFRAEILGHLK